jgi:hypothetical protein
MDYLKQMVYADKKNSDDMDFTQALATYIDALMVYPTFSRPVIQFYRGAESNLLRTPGKEKGRPIGKTCSYAKLGDAFSTKKTKKERDAHFANLQYGVGAPFGTEKMLNVSRVTHEIKSPDGHDLLRSDSSNAFQNVHRGVILTEACQVTPELSRALISAYADHQYITYVGCPDGVRFIQQEVGTTQGATRGSLDYGYGTLPLAKQCQEAVNSTDYTPDQQGLHRAYADDSATIAPTHAIVEVVDLQSDYTWSYLWRISQYRQIHMPPRNQT